MFENIFWKVWRNNILKNQILSEIKIENIGFNFKKDELGDRLDYNNIVSLEWMLINKQYSMIKDKLLLLNNFEIHITKESIIKLITTCTHKETFEILFEKKRKELERVDLIIESINQESEFSLSTFINLYGGPEIISNKTQFKDYYLLDYAIANSKFKISEFILLNYQNTDLVKYTESKLLYNNDRIDLLKKEIIEKYSYRNYIPYRARYKNSQSIYSLPQPRSYNNLLSVKTRIKQDLKNLHNKDIFQKKRESESKSFDIVEIVPPHYYSDYQSKYKNEIIGENNKRMNFIENTLGHKIEELIEKGGISLPPLQSLGYNNMKIKHILAILKKLPNWNGLSDSSPNLKNSFYINYDKEFLICNLLIEHIKYNYGDYKSTGSGKISGHDGIISYFKQLESQLVDIDYLVQNNSKLLSTYFIDYQFYKENEIGLNLIENKSFSFMFAAGLRLIEPMNHLFNLSFLNFSINGLKLFLELFNTHCRNSFSMSRFTIDTSLLDFNFKESTFPQQPQRKSLSTIENLIKFFKYLEENEKESRLTDGYEKFTKLLIPWSQLIEVIVKWYDYSILESLINNCPFFKFNFKNNQSISLQVFCIPNGITGKFEIDKLNLFINRNKNIIITKEELNNYKIDSSYSQTKYDLNLYYSNDNSIILEERIKLINYLSKLLNDQIINDLLFYEIFNNLFYNIIHSNNLTTVEDLILIYSNLNNKTNFENYIFDSILENSILSKDIKSIIQILSIVNKNQDNLKELNNSNINNSIDKLWLINYLYSNKLLKVFGSNLAKRLIINLNELELLNVLPTILKSLDCKKDDSFYKFIIDLSIKNNGEYYFKIFKLLINYFQDESSSNKNNYNLVLQLLLNSFNDKIKPINYQDNIKKFEKDQSNLLKLFQFGHKELMFNIIGIKKIQQNQDTYLKILALSSEYCRLEDYIEIYEQLLEPLEGSSTSYFHDLLGFAILYNRLDIIKYLFDKFEITTNEYSYFLEVFTYGEIRISKYLLEEQSQLFIQDSSSGNDKSSLSLNNIFKEVLFNGHVDLLKLLFQHFPNFKIGKILINQVIINGYHNIIEYLHSINKLIDLDYILNSKSSQISSNGKININISDKLLFIINEIIQQQQEKQGQKQEEQEQKSKTSKTNKKRSIATTIETTRQKKSKK